MDPDRVLSDGEYFIDEALYVSDRDTVFSENNEFVGDLEPAEISYCPPGNGYDLTMSVLTISILTMSLLIISFPIKSHRVIPVHSMSPYSERRDTECL